MKKFHHRWLKSFRQRLKRLKLLKSKKWERYIQWILKSNRSPSRGLLMSQELKKCTQGPKVPVNFSTSNHWQSRKSHRQSLIPKNWNFQYQRRSVSLIRNRWHSLKSIDITSRLSMLIVSSTIKLCCRRWSLILALERVGKNNLMQTGLPASIMKSLKSLLSSLSWHASLNKMINHLASGRW